MATVEMTNLKSRKTWNTRKQIWWLVIVTILILKRELHMNLIAPLLTQYYHIKTWIWIYLFLFVNKVTRINLHQRVISSYKLISWQWIWKANCFNWVLHRRSALISKKQPQQYSQEKRNTRKSYSEAASSSFFCDDKYLHEASTKERKRERESTLQLGVVWMKHKTRISKLQYKCNSAISTNNC